MSFILTHPPEDCKNKTKPKTYCNSCCMIYCCACRATSFRSSPGTPRLIRYPASLVASCGQSCIRRYVSTHAPCQGMLHAFESQTGQTVPPTAAPGTTVPGNRAQGNPLLRPNPSPKLGEQAAGTQAQRLAKAASAVVPTFCVARACNSSHLGQMICMICMN